MKITQIFYDGLKPGTKILFVWLLGIMAVGILLCVLFALLKIAVKAMVIVAGCARIVCNHRHKCGYCYNNAKEKIEDHKREENAPPRKRP